VLTKERKSGQRGSVFPRRGDGITRPRLGPGSFAPSKKDLSEQPLTANRPCRICQTVNQGEIGVGDTSHRLNLWAKPELELNEMAAQSRLPARREKPGKIIRVCKVSHKPLKYNRLDSNTSVRYVAGLVSSVCASPCFSYDALGFPGSAGGVPLSPPTTFRLPSYTLCVCDIRRRPPPTRQSRSGGSGI
jgi:hypothetical protein